jgi:hypothetical protein
MRLPVSIGDEHARADKTTRPKRKTEVKITERERGALCAKHRGAESGIDRQVILLTIMAS